MFKTAFILVILLAFILADIDFHPVSKSNLSAIPLDDGKSNYGDYVWGLREFMPDVTVYYNEIFINTETTNDQFLKFSKTVDDKYDIVGVRFLNLGRQRIYTHDVAVDYKSVKAYIDIPADIEGRLLIQIIVMDAA